MFEEMLGIAILLIVVGIIGLILVGAWQKSLAAPGDKCFLCGRQLQPNEESILFTTKIQGIQVQKRFCVDCMQKTINEQGGICPYCKEPIKWNERLSFNEFVGKWFHPECLFGLQHGKPSITKETTKEVIIKVRCPYCGHTYDESLDKCPHCGAKHV